MTDYTYQNLNTWNRWKWFIGQSLWLLSQKYAPNW